MANIDYKHNKNFIFNLINYTVIAYSNSITWPAH